MKISQQKAILMLTFLISFVFLLTASNPKIQPQQDTFVMLTWNIANFGKSKDDAEILFVAKTIKNADIVSIQEVSTGAAGAKAVAQLADELNRMGAKWDYTISDPTTGNGSERYAFLWKTAKIKNKTRPWLEKDLDALIDREPYLGRFTFNGKDFLMVNFHAIPKSKKPATEIVELVVLQKKYATDRLFMMGDFNYPESGEAFETLKAAGLTSSFVGQKTSLKQVEKDGQSLANEYDNIFYETNQAQMKDSKAILFFESFSDLKAAKLVSDHIPLQCTFSLQ